MCCLISLLLSVTIQTQCKSAVKFTFRPNLGYLQSCTGGTISRLGRWVKYESIIRKTKRVGGRGVDLNITIILDPWFFWNYIVYFDGGLVAPVSRSEFDEILDDFHKILCIIDRIYSLRWWNLDESYWSKDRLWVILSPPVKSRGFIFL